MSTRAAKKRGYHLLLLAAGLSLGVGLAHFFPAAVGAVSDHQGYFRLGVGVVCLVLWLIAESSDD